MCAQTCFQQQSWSHSSIRDQTTQEVDFSCFNFCKSIRNHTFPELKSITSKTQFRRNCTSLVLVLFLDNDVLKWKLTLFFLSGVFLVDEGCGREWSVEVKWTPVLQSVICKSFLTSYDYQWLQNSEIWFWPLPYDSSEIFQGF